MRALWFRIRNAIRTWWVNPAASPEKIGKGKEGEYRPIPIELGFYLHATGRVYHRSRRGDGDRLVTDPHLIGMVHREYRTMVALAKEEQGWARQALRKLRIMRKAMEK